MTWVSSLRAGRIISGVKGKKADSLLNNYKQIFNIKYNYEIDIWHFTNWAGLKGHKVIW